MAQPPVLNDPGRRRWVATASIAGGAGVVATSIPFVASLAPSERARALGASVEVDIQPIPPGELVTVEWRGKPVWVLKRTPQMLETLRKHDDLLSDPRSTRDQQPDYARNEFRSIKPEIGVLVAQVQVHQLAREVEVPVALVVPERRALAPSDGQRVDQGLRAPGMEHVRAVVGADARLGGLVPRVDERVGHC